LFDAIAAKAGLSDGSVNIHELAEETGAEPLLISKFSGTSNNTHQSKLTITVRIMRFLAAMSVVEEVCQGSYKSTSLVAALVSSSPLSAAMIHR